MASRIDDKLFVALLRGDHEALAAGWTTAFKCALRFAVSLFGGKYVCFAGKSAEDVASDATLKFVQAVASGQVTEGNVYGYLSRTVHTTFIDLIRKASREAHADDRWADGEISSLDHAADPSLTQEQAMLAREEEEARERAQHAMLHDALLLWCEWPGTMMCWCEKRAALVATLEQMQSYLRQRLDLAGAPKGGGCPETLRHHAEFADPFRVRYSFAEFNEFLMARLGITRTTLDQRWKYLRGIACRHGLPMPPGLHGNNGADGRRRRASRTNRRTPVSTEAALAPPTAGDEWTSTRTPAAATPHQG